MVDVGFGAVPISPTQVFAYVADFSNTAHWHPGVRECRQLTAGSPIRVGARFHVVSEQYGWTTDRTFEVIDVIDDHVLVLQDDAAGPTATVSITVLPKADGCVVRYRADMRLRGLSTLATPMVRLVLRRAGRELDNELRRLLVGWQQRAQ